MTASQIDFPTHAPESHRLVERPGELACAALAFAAVAGTWLTFLLFVAGQVSRLHVG